MEKVVVLANYWAADYKIQLFRNIYKSYREFLVLYIAESEELRDWIISKDELDYPHKIMFDGQIDDIGLIRVIVSTWKSLNELKPDILVISGYSYISYWIGFLWTKISRKKVILWSASNYEDKSKIIMKEQFKRCLVSRCDAANVYGLKNKMYLQRLGMSEGKIFIKGNVCDNEFFAYNTAEMRRKKNELCNRAGLPERNFIYVGRLSPEKNIMRLLETYKKLREKHNITWGLILVGSGPLENDVKNYIKDNDLKYIFLAGFQQKKDIPRYLAMGDVLILPSISEPWGLVVNEAMASGLPVIVSKKCGCYPDLIREGINGFSFDPFNVDDLSDLMLRIIGNSYDVEHMGKKSQEIISRYTPENAANVVIKTIHYVLNAVK